MAPRHSLTIQINPSLPGHAAVVVNEPSRQTYAGFGPQRHYSPWSNGKFDVHSVQGGDTPPSDFSSVVGEGQYKTFTIPVTEEQTARALAEIDRIRNSNQNYNAFDANVCTTIVNQILEASGLGRDVLPRIIPSQNNEFLSNVESALTANPKARVAFDGAGLANAIPQSLRSMQSDYAFVGGGYDTPSERHGRLPSGPLPAQQPAPSFSDRFGDWPASPNGDVSINRDQMPPADGPSARPERYLRGRLVDGSGRSVFDTGTPAVPFVPSGPLAPQPPASFDDRYGRWGASPTASVPLGSYQTGLSRGPPGPASEADPRRARVLRSRVIPPGDAGSGQPAVAYPAPPIFGLSDPSAAFGDDMNDWFTRWVKPLIRQ
jgi:hypothetical protein